LLEPAIAEGSPGCQRSAEQVTALFNVTLIVT